MNLMKSNFGAQLRYVASVLDAHKHPLHAGASQDEAQERVQLANDYTRVVMQVAVSVAVLIGSFWLLMKGPNENVQKAASGFIGLVIGYWLR